MKSRPLFVFVVSAALAVALLLSLGCAPKEAEPAAKEAAAPAAEAAAAPTTGEQPYQGDYGPIELKWSSFCPTDFFVHTVGVKWWQDELSKRSNGRVTIKLYENAVLGELKAHYDLVLAGTADIVFFVSGHEPGRFPMSEILELPTFTPSGEIRSPAVAATARKYVEPYDYMDVKNLTWANPGGWDLFTAKKPVRSLADFKGLKVFVSSPAQAKAMEACGAVPVVMDASEIYTAVERGVLDGIVFHWGGADGFNFHKICKYVTKIGIGGAVHSSAMNLKTWKSLPPGVKRIFEDLLKEAPVVMGRMYDDQDKKVVEKFKAEGMEIIELPEAERKAVYDKFAVVFDEWVARRGRDGYPTREAVDFLLAETEKSIAEWVRTHPE